MQVGVERRHLVGMVGIGVQLVIHVEVVERGLQDERGRKFEDVLGSLRGILQQHVHLAPRHVVAYGDAGVQDEPVLGRGGTEVRYVAPENQGVGDGDWSSPG